jgi:ribA/ribD-fused uncharacterized protein
MVHSLCTIDKHVYKGHFLGKPILDKVAKTCTQSTMHFSRARRSHNGCILTFPMLRPDPAVPDFAQETIPMTVFFGAGCFLSNHFKTPFKYGKHQFQSSEQAYSWFKAKFFGNRRIASEILVSKGAFAARNLCNTVQAGRDVSGWLKLANNYMRLVLRHKFYSHATLAAELLATGLSYIAYADVGDSYWGIGRGLNDPDACDRWNFKGKNHLGKLLMELRAEMVNKLDSNRLNIPDVRACLDRIERQSKFRCHSCKEIHIFLLEETERAVDSACQYVYFPEKFKISILIVDDETGKAAVDVVDMERTIDWDDEEIFADLQRDFQDLQVFLNFLSAIMHINY